MALLVFGCPESYLGTSDGSGTLKVTGGAYAGSYDLDLGVAGEAGQFKFQAGDNLYSSGEEFEIVLSVDSFPWTVGRHLPETVRLNLEARESRSGALEYGASYWMPAWNDESEGFFIDAIRPAEGDTSVGSLGLHRVGEMDGHFKIALESTEGETVTVEMTYTVSPDCGTAGANAANSNLQMFCF